MTATDDFQQSSLQLQGRAKKIDNLCSLSVIDIQYIFYFENVIVIILFSYFYFDFSRFCKFSSCICFCCHRSSFQNDEYFFLLMLLLLLLEIHLEELFSCFLFCFIYSFIHSTRQSRNILKGIDSSDYNHQQRLSRMRCRCRCCYARLQREFQLSSQINNRTDTGLFCQK